MLKGKRRSNKPLAKQLPKRYAGQHPNERTSLHSENRPRWSPSMFSHIPNTFQLLCSRLPLSTQKYIHYMLRGRLQCLRPMQKHQNSIFLSLRQHRLYLHLLQQSRLQDSPTKQKPEHSAPTRPQPQNSRTQLRLIQATLTIQ